MVPDLPDDFGASNENLPPGIKINKEHFTTDFFSLPLQNLLPVFNKTENCIRIRKFLRILQNPIDSSSLQGRNGLPDRRPPDRHSQGRGRDQAAWSPAFFSQKPRAAVSPRETRARRRAVILLSGIRNPSQTPKQDRHRGRPLEMP